MAEHTQTENLVHVKAALADKYERLARVCRSKPARLRLLRHVQRFRQQAANARKGISK